MASSMMHLAVAERFADGVSRPDLFRLGCVLVDACGQAGHFRAKTADGRRYYDLPRFRREYSERLLTDDYCLGYYLHLVQDMVYRKFVYEDNRWNPRSPDDVKRLHNDYRLLNPVLAKKYGLQPLTLPEDAPGRLLLPATASAFIADMAGQFEPYDNGEFFFLTEALASAYVDRAAEVCRMELDSLRSGAPGVDPLDYAYTSGFQIREMMPSERPLLGILCTGEESSIEAFGQNPGDFALVAELDDQLVGAIWARRPSGDATELAVSVPEAHRGKGYGSRMMFEMLKYLRAVGCKRASLTLLKNDRALGMFQRSGFQIAGEDEKEIQLEICL